MGNTLANEPDDPMLPAQSAAALGSQAAQAMDCGLFECYENQEAGLEVKDGLLRVVYSPQPGYRHASLHVGVRDGELSARLRAARSPGRTPPAKESKAPLSGPSQEGDGQPALASAETGAAVAPPKAEGDGAGAPELQPRRSPHFEKWASKGMVGQSDAADSVVPPARSALHGEPDSQAGAGTAAAPRGAEGEGAGAPELLPRRSPHVEKWASTGMPRRPEATHTDVEAVDAVVRLARAALQGQPDSKSPALDPLATMAALDKGVVDKLQKGVRRLHATSPKVADEGRIDLSSSPILNAVPIAGRADGQPGADGTALGRQIDAADNGAVRKDLSPHATQASPSKPSTAKPSSAKPLDPPCSSALPTGLSGSQGSRQYRQFRRYRSSADEGELEPATTEAFAVLDPHCVVGREPSGIDLALIAEVLTHTFRIKAERLAPASQLFECWTIPPGVAIVEQGMPVSSGPAFSILSEGTVDVFVRPAGGAHSEHMLTYDKPGQCFGNVELLHPALASSAQRRRHWATMATRTPVVLWAVRQGALHKFMRDS